MQCPVFSEALFTSLCYPFLFLYLFSPLLNLSHHFHPSRRTNSSLLSFYLSLFPSIVFCLSHHSSSSYQLLPSSLPLSPPFPFSSLLNLSIHTVSFMQSIFFCCTIDTERENQKKKKDISCSRMIEDVQRLMTSRRPLQTCKAITMKSGFTYNNERLDT